MIRSEKYRDLVITSAARWGAYYGVTVPVPVVLAMIMAESSGIPTKKRTEPDGRISRGLMQVLEGTAKELGLADPMKLHDPAIGIDVGVKYLARQLARYRGVLASAIAAYNAGTAVILKNKLFKNQIYVDKVNKWLKSLETGSTAPRGRAALLVSVVLLGAFAAAAAGQARKHAHAA